MGRKKHDVSMAPITDADMARFHRNAPAALARRGGDFVAETLADAVGQIAMGAAPIVGMWAFGWSASELLVFLLAGAWIGVFCDLALLWNCGRGVERFAQAKYDDWHVWVVVDALRAGRSEAPASHLTARYEPWMGVFVDFVMGGVSTAFMCLMLANEQSDFDASRLRASGVLWGLAGLAAYRIAVTAWELVQHRAAGDEGRDVKVAVGMRGLGLFMLLALFVIVGEGKVTDAQLTRSVMLAVNGAVVAAGALNALGPLWLRGDTAWLDDYLKRRRGRQDAQG